MTCEEDGDCWYSGALTEGSNEALDDQEMRERRQLFRDWVRHLDAVGGEPLPLFGATVDVLPLRLAA